MILINQLVEDMITDVNHVMFKLISNGEKIIGIILMKMLEIIMELIFKLELVKICMLDYGVF